jgi:biotin operon repressor
MRQDENLPCESCGFVSLPNPAELVQAYIGISRIDTNQDGCRIESLKDRAVKIDQIDRDFRLIP